MSPALHISIPESSVAHPPSSKAYTEYHIVLDLPLKRNLIKRRYAEFETLHKDLVAQTGSTPPAPLPAKGWFTRTVNNEVLTEQRRFGLEGYLRAIMDTDDPSWRSSSAWRAFLGLQTETGHDQSDRGSTQRQMMDASEWLEQHRKLKSKIQQARQQIKQRDEANTVQQQHNLSAEAKATLVRAATSIEELSTALGTHSAKDGHGQMSSQLGAGEWRRRKDMISAAKKEVQALDGILRTSARNNAPTETVAAAATPRDGGLMAARSKPSGRVLGPAKETERTRELNNNGVVQLQQQIMQEQDEDVMLLGKAVSRLKDMGVVMNEELEIQNAMLKVVEEDIDRVQGKIDVGRKRIQKIK